MRAISPLLLLLACSNTSKPTPGELSQDSPGGAESATPSGESGQGESTPPDTAGRDTQTSPVESGAGDSGGDDSGGGESGAETAGGDSGATDTGGAPDVESCFDDLYTDAATSVPDYTSYGATIGSHCDGTNMQDIADIDRVVFVGDSITVGSPPTDPSEFYRSILAENLASEFGLEAPDWTWEWYNAVDGTSLVMNSGDFWSCAKWGARTDDLMRDNDQIVDCMPTDEWDRTTLVVMTMGGNDLFSLVKGYTEGKTSDELWDQTYEMAELQREAVGYLKDPANWGAPVYVIFANVYEFTDGTGDWSTCPGADLAGLEDALTDPEFADMLNWINEEYLSIAVDTGADMVFLREGFCGHGYGRDETDSYCDRGADAALWFDLTCIHPNSDGHAALADMFQQVVDE